MIASLRRIVTSVLGGIALLIPLQAWAQQTGLGSQTLRGHWHVFIAYAVAWLVIFGWLVAVFRRMGRLDRELDGS